MSKGPLRIIAVVSFGLAPSAFADTRPARQGTQAQPATQDQGWAEQAYRNIEKPAWADKVLKSKSGWKKAGEKALESAEKAYWSNWDETAKAAKLSQLALESGKTQATWLSGIGKKLGWAGQVPKISGILGALSGGDRAGAVQETANALLSGLVTAAAATAAVFFLPATAPIGAVLATGMAGAVVAGTAYEAFVKPVVDQAFDGAVEFGLDREDIAQRLARARLWLADADTACADARRAIAGGRRAASELDTTAETVRWLQGESKPLEGALADARRLAEQARGSANPSELATSAEDEAAAGVAAAQDGDGYAQESCRIRGQMSSASQLDALRIWNTADRYLGQRASSVAERAKQAAAKARDLATRAEEVNALRRRAAAALAQATARAASLTAHIEGGRARLAQAKDSVSRAERLRVEATAASEDCHAARQKILALLGPYRQYHLVELFLKEEVVLTQPPFAELEGLADLVPVAEASIARNIKDLEWLTATLADWRRALGESQPPPPDDAAAERARAAAGRAEAGASQAGRAAEEAARCAQEASALATRAAEEASENAAEHPGTGVEDLLRLAEGAYSRCNDTLAAVLLDRASAMASGDPRIARLRGLIAARQGDQGPCQNDQPPGLRVREEWVDSTVESVRVPGNMQSAEGWSDWKAGAARTVGADDSAADAASASSATGEGWRAGAARTIGESPPPPADTSSQSRERAEEEAGAAKARTRATQDGQQGQNTAAVLGGLLSTLTEIYNRATSDGGSTGGSGGGQPSGGGQGSGGRGGAGGMCHVQEFGGRGGVTYVIEQTHPAGRNLMVLSVDRTYAISDVLRQWPGARIVSQSANYSVALKAAQDRCAGLARASKPGQTTCAEGILGDDFGTACKPQ